MTCWADHACRFDPYFHRDEDETLPSPDYIEEQIGNALEQLGFEDIFFALQSSPDFSKAIHRYIQRQADSQIDY